MKTLHTAFTLLIYLLLLLVAWMNWREGGDKWPV
jgi:hypothetical protein